MILNGKKARLYNYLIEILNQHMDNYNYEFVIGETNANKYYINDLKNIEIHVKNSLDKISDAEVISLGYNLFKRMGLEDVEILINKDNEMNDILDMLEIYYINDDSDILSWSYMYEDAILGVGSKNSNEITVKINIEILINAVMNIIRDNALDVNIDVSVIGVSEEESYHALKIAQDLRINNINCVINEKVNSKFNILLDEEDLNKGIISIKDNYTEEVIKIDEADVLEYILGNV